MKKIFFILIILFLFGCTTSKGFNREYLRSSLKQGMVVSEENIAKVLNAKPQLTKPFKLAIYYNKPGVAKPVFNLNVRNEIKWDGEDKKLFEWYLSDLVVQGKVREIIRLNNSIVDGSGIKNIRLGAARVGADALLVVNSVSDVDRYNNSFGVTYALLATAFFVPASEMDALVMLNATMWDVRNEYLYLSSEVEHVEHQTRPAYFIDVKGAITTSKKHALKVLGNDVRDRVLNMR